ncbi:type VI secretion system protein TssL, long form [Glaciimonas immobilis]|uniref:Type VI secretion system protein ImpK n=1 Tax=Glaciimonas immobilis TaxID=728004 RepID=A0A840RRW6_9BURK|nr:type VI secretion system protein TssL, long form [Glaciimonas immobilis]KAF3998078.1 type VI secretion system protein TssL [Glaciimonas immobilis]MBB5199229.1 type VI secretion system protein ImpK [Glaciimonas immobilis]
MTKSEQNDSAQPGANDADIGIKNATWAVPSTSVLSPVLSEAEESPKKQKNIANQTLEAFDRTTNLQSRLVNIMAAGNPLLEAARPLLRTLADMPDTLSEGGNLESFYTILADEVTDFQTLCDKANLPWKQMAAVRYCLCTALDESVNRTHWAGGEWAQKSLLITFEGESDGGEKFFLLVGRMVNDPQEYRNVLEVLFRILGLGFEGRYSVLEDGRRHLSQIRQRLLTYLNGARDQVKPALSPHCTGEPAGRMRLLRSIPIWTSSSVLALTLFSLFSVYKYRLLEISGEIETNIVAVAKKSEPKVLSIFALPTLRKAHPLRLSVSLKDEIDRGLLTVTEDAERSVLTFKGDVMFKKAQSQMQQEIGLSLEKVAIEIARVNGAVTIVGHTDSQRIHTSEFPDNGVLSEKRAALIAEYLRGHGVAASRINAIGRGAEEPIASNSTVAGRARNRRVDIIVKQ